MLQGMLLDFLLRCLFLRLHDDEVVDDDEGEADEVELLVVLYKLLDVL